jgi:hypothetical protein
LVINPQRGTPVQSSDLSPFSWHGIGFAGPNNWGKATENPFSFLSLLPALFALVRVLFFLHVLPFFQPASLE